MKTIIVVYNGPKSLNAFIPKYSQLIQIHLLNGEIHNLLFPDQTDASKSNTTVDMEDENIAHLATYQKDQRLPAHVIILLAGSFKMGITIQPPNKDERYEKLHLSAGDTAIAWPEGFDVRSWQNATDVQVSHDLVLVRLRKKIGFADIVLYLTHAR